MRRSDALGYHGEDFICGPIHGGNISVHLAEGGSVGGRGLKIRDVAKGRRQANGREIFPMAGQSTSSWPSAKTLQSGKHDIPNKLGPSLGSHSQVRLFSAF